jgi:hypothetical protein
LRLCSLAPETTIWLPVGIGHPFYETEQMFGSAAEGRLRNLRAQRR